MARGRAAAVPAVVVVLAGGGTGGGARALAGGGTDGEGAVAARGLAVAERGGMARDAARSGVDAGGPFRGSASSGGGGALLALLRRGGGVAAGAALQEGARLRFLGRAPPEAAAFGCGTVTSRELDRGLGPDETSRDLGPSESGSDLAPPEIEPAPGGAAVSLEVGSGRAAGGCSRLAGRVGTAG